MDAYEKFGHGDGPYNEKSDEEVWDDIEHLSKGRLFEIITEHIPPLNIAIKFRAAMICAQRNEMEGNTDMPDPVV